MIRDRVPVLRLGLKEEIAAEVQIELTVAIVICRGHARETALWKGSKAESIALQLERAVALVEEQVWTSAAQNDQVLPAQIAQVQKQSTGGFIQHVDVRLRTDVYEAAVNVFVQTVRQPAWLADIYLIHAIIIDVAHGNAIAAVNLDYGGGIEPRNPKGHAPRKMLCERRYALENGACNVAK